MYESYQYVFIGALAFSLLLLALSVLIFFLLDIRKAAGDVFGLKKRRAMKGDPTDKKKKYTKAIFPVQGANIDSSGRKAEVSYETTDEKTTTLTGKAPTPEPAPRTDVIPAVFRERPSVSGFIVEDEITFVHASEIIS